MHMFAVFVVMRREEVNRPSTSATVTLNDRSNAYIRRLLADDSQTAHVRGHTCAVAILVNMTEEYLMQVAPNLHNTLKNAMLTSGGKFGCVTNLQGIQETDAPCESTAQPTSPTTLPSP